MQDELIHLQIEEPTAMTDQAFTAQEILQPGLKLVHLKGNDPAKAMSSAFIASLFDQYADRFDNHLTKALQYKGPEIILEALQKTCALKKTPLQFDNAAEAVYFAKQRGWKYVVEKPLFRYARNDDCQYQDNFLPQKVALKVQEEGTRCDEWKRKSAATSHYFRPLKYHGDGTVRQHGPNASAPIAPHVEGCYKIR